MNAEILVENGKLSIKLNQTSFDDTYYFMRMWEKLVISDESYVAVRFGNNGNKDTFHMTIPLGLKPDEPKQDKI